MGRSFCHIKGQTQAGYSEARHSGNVVLEEREERLCHRLETPSFKERPSREQGV